MTFYILAKGNKIVPLEIMGADGKINEENFIKFDEFFNEVKNRQIGYDKIGEQVVSTVFTCFSYFDYSYSTGEPILFETAVFNKSKSVVVVKRYGSFEKAVTGHKEICKRIRMEKIAFHDEF